METPKQELSLFPQHKHPPRHTRHASRQYSAFHSKTKTDIRKQLEQKRTYAVGILTEKHTGMLTYAYATLRVSAAMFKNSIVMNYARIKRIFTIFALIVSSVALIFKPMRTSVSVYATPTIRNMRIIAALDEYLKEYKVSVLGRNAHIATMLGYLRPIKCPSVYKIRQFVETFDGNTIALDWLFPKSARTGTRFPKSEHFLKPGGDKTDTQIVHVLVILHGLNGHADEPYVRSFVSLGSQCGWYCVAVNWRGCGGQKMRSPYGYSVRCTGGWVGGFLQFF